MHVPDAFVQISSIMPQKRNPVPVEHLRLMCSLAAGRADSVLLALHNTPFTDMNDAEGEVQVAGYAAFDTVERFASAADRARWRRCEIDEDAGAAAHRRELHHRDGGGRYAGARGRASRSGRRMRSPARWRGG